jgi:hypothetical protein
VLAQNSPQANFEPETPTKSKVRVTMSDPILVAVAWPYANAEIHVGNLTGSYLPADIFARYQRLRGRDVLMVSGSDSHGTPITVRADAEGSDPLTVYHRFHETFLDLFQKLGLTYDLYTSTHTSNHFRISCIRPATCSGTRLARGDSFPTVTWKAPATSAASPMPAVTSVITAETC